MLPIKNRKSKPAKRRKPTFRYGSGWLGSYYEDRPFLFDPVERARPVDRFKRWKSPPKPPRVCARCDATEFHKVFSAPMLRDELWLSLGVTKKEVMCFECVEETLGRQLTVDDIMPNSPMYGGVIQMLRRVTCPVSSS